MVEKDYIMRIIHEMVRTIIRLVFHRDEESQEELVFLDGANEDFYQKLCLLTDEGKMNEAENQLYQRLEPEEMLEEENLENLKLALAFYDYLNNKDNDFLESHDYSREEIREGICDVMKRFGYGGLAETLLENH